MNFRIIYQNKIIGKVFSDFIGSLKSRFAQANPSWVATTSDPSTTIRILLDVVPIYVNRIGGVNFTKNRLRGDILVAIDSFIGVHILKKT